MANVIIKSDERRSEEAYVARRFGMNRVSSDNKDAIETITARTREAIEKGSKPERKYY